MPCGKRAAARRGTPSNPTGAAACFHPTHSLSAPGPGFAAGSPVPENATKAFPVRKSARSPPQNPATFRPVADSSWHDTSRNLASGIRTTAIDGPG
jgi:hypothetical protein